MANSQYLNRSHIPVSENGNNIPNPWSGGLNACQFSAIDLNQDNVQDLFVFDRAGDRVLTFINNGAMDYSYAPEYISAFPTLSDWALLADYNCDGKADIFAYNEGYVSVYKNTSNSSTLSFELEEDVLLTDYGSLISGILISYVDIPAIIDVDNDGDLDILTFQQTGGHIEFHKNLSIEENGNCDALNFVMETNCWGDFYEGLNVYEFNACSEENPIAANTNTQRSDGAHAGSASLALDMDGDGDKEIVLGDVSYNNLNLIHNTGTVAEADMSAADQDFPIGSGSSVSAEINSFPAAFYVDVNSDGKRDLLVSPNIRNNSENTESIKLFLNEGADDAPSFSHHQNNFLQDNTIDFGSGAYPALIDYNNDGLKDLLVGNHGYYDSGDHTAQLALFKNTGSANAPSFALIDRDFGGFSQIPLNTILNTPVAGLTPTLADLDNDGDDDLIVGDADGKLHYFSNIASTGNDAQFNLTTVNLNNIDIGQFAAPFLYDMNGDNLFDLIVGQHNGTLSYFENIGDANNPVFGEEVENFGGVSVANDWGTYGFSKPFFYAEDGNTQLLVGTQSGYIYHYNNIDENLEGSFNLLSANFQNIRDGEKVSLLYEDFSNDGKRDLFLGNESGGLFYFVNDTLGNSIANNEKASAKIYPNPATHNIYIDVVGEKMIFNVLGELVLKSQEQHINIQHLPNGMYWIRCHKTAGKFIKQ